VFDGGAGLCLVRRLRANDAAHRERGVVRVCAGSREGSCARSRGTPRLRASGTVPSAVQSEK
jgi:hypothetical protein